ncbi:Gfo/Idh/MocA family protein [Paenibacillus arenilitoris]|uniref:Gfo/Idh/MocA family oxidoreductase n=1 Tax=Paenibacillus arenilitoris TaxID=2772299 RepID=A0A927CJE7_9BACL|nr:Gfo/Idh/MocA family oxidoreductase [Paenibacillus arenilitoris]MBD2868614.1 Gfo/Idh/MocA family oxidoreductase [Paenibacillus arenilitoris]
MSKFRIGLIGLGGMAGEHIRWMNENGRFDVVAVSDVSENALAAAGDRLGIAAGKRYADFAGLIEDPDVEAVISVTPNNVHAAIIRACLQARKPFMAEKPFTLDFEEAAGLLELYENRPVPAMMAFTYRYTPAYRFARELVREGKIGDVRSFSIQYLQGWGAAPNDVPYIWRFDKAVTGTGTLGDLGSHMIDMARFLFGEFEELSAQLHTIIPKRKDPATGEPVTVEVDDFASFQARMADGAMGVFQTTRNAVGSGNQHEASIYGDTGTIHASTLNPDRLIWIREEAPGQFVRSEIDVPQRCRVKQYEDFAALLEGGSPDGLAGFMDGYRNQQVLDAVVRASEAKTSVRL